jgi:Ca2+-binding RTX toxin-like protein
MAMTAAVLALVLAVPPNRAVASTVTQLPSDGGFLISYIAAPGETNGLSISRGIDGYTIEDSGAAIAPDAPCARPTPANTHIALCPADGVRALHVLLDDRNDHLAIADSATPPEPPPPGEFPVQVSGGEGNDVLAGGAAPAALDGGPDDDTLAGGLGNDWLTGGDGKDALDGGDGDDNPLWGGAGVDTIDGGAGNDQLQGGEDDDKLRGGAGNDRLDFKFFGDESDESGDDLLDGGPGDDVLNGGPARTQQDPDTLIGGDGTDTADFSERTSPLKIDLDDRADDGESGEHDDVNPDVEGVIGGSDGDTLIGSAAPNILDGRRGDDTIVGGGGDDRLQGGVNDPGGDNLSGGAGIDTMTGGPGDDSLAGGDGSDDESGGGGTDTVEGEDGDDTLTGGAGGDTVNGGAGNDSLNGGEVGLVGGDGRDDLNGGPGRDSLLGGRGNDQLDGGLGPDYISGETEKDTVTYEDRTSKVTVTLDGQNNDGEAGEGDNVLPDVETVVGGVRGDDLSGDGDVNTVDGGRGEDFIDGNLDPDRLLGGDAPDVIRSRDGVADEVACGDGGDLVIADDRDKLIECETVDRPSARRLTVGKYALVLPQGEFRLRLPEGRRFFALAENLKIPIRSTIDPEAGVVRLATARNRAGARQIASVSAGRFTVRQRGDRRPVTELRLAGGSPRCRGSSGGRGRAKRPPPPKLAVDVAKNKRRVRYAVLGEYSLAAATGTAWVTEDRCDGTLTRVTSGTVQVRDFGRDRTVKVRAGTSYLARAR